MANTTIFSTNFTQIAQTVEIMWKSTWKTWCKFIVKLSAKPFSHTSNRAKPLFSSHFSHLSHQLSHPLANLLFNYFFHISTAPTIITTNNKFIERI